MRRLPLRLIAVFFAISVVLALSACATLESPALKANRPETLPAATVIADVPFFDQQDRQCGPAALATVLGHWGRPADPVALSSRMYVPARGGSLQIEMTAAARRSGMLALASNARLQDVLQSVAAGQPVVVLQNLGLSFAPRWHYATVVGYDLPAGQIVLHSGADAWMRMSLRTFEYTWARSGRWTLAVVPPDRLPATAREPDAAQAAVALERTDKNAALQAYVTIAGRWPDNLVARIGLANAAYAEGDVDAAQSHLEVATRAHPASADAWNNLAQVLIRRGNGAAARNAAAQAVAIGGERQAVYLATQAEAQSVTVK
jgi:Peptidase_C39 like family/Tetratricopeptide repeat